MKNNKLSREVILTGSFILFNCINAISQNLPSLTGVTQATTSSWTTIQAIVVWAFGVAALSGGVFVGFKLFAGKPDARDGILYWIGGVIFCAVVAVVTGLSTH